MDRREQLFWKKVDKISHPNGCWLWMNETCGKTHGTVNYKGYRTGAHRIAWILTKGPIPEGKVLMHACDNGICVNPDHLKIGTQHDNMLDMWAKGRGKNPVLKGEKHGMAQVTAEQVIEIRNSYATGTISQQALADRYGLGQTQVGRIIHGETWKHLPSMASVKTFNRARRQRIYTDEFVKELVNLRQQGMSLVDVGAKHNIRFDTVSKMVKRYLKEHPDGTHNPQHGQGMAQRQHDH